MWSRYAAGLLLAVAFLTATAATASAETRTLKFYNLHTKERAEITYKRNGRYIQSGLTEVNRFLRDWRRNEPTKMNPHLLDLVWEVYRQSGSRDYINVICGYRAPATNAMLRSRSSGVAKKSQHTLGNALDFYLPDVKLSKLRAIGLKMEAGGVGFYPSSGSPFVHMDVGNVRHWPRMSRKQLMAVFPDGKTMHVPTDGKPLPGYNQAVAAYEARKRSGNTIQVASGSGRSGGGLFGGLFGGGADDEEDTAIASAAPPQSMGSRRTRAAKPSQPVQAAQPEAAPAAEETPGTLLAALPARSVPLPRAAPRPEVAVGQTASQPTPDQIPFAIASAEPVEPSADASSTEMALNVPLPTRRPDYTPQPTVEETIVAASDEVFAPETRSNASDAIAQVLRADEKVVTASAAAAYLPIPTVRPRQASEQFALAAIPQPKPIALAAESAENKSFDVFAADEQERAATSAGSRVSDSQRLALLSNEDRTEPAAIISGGVKTTGKGARPSIQDSKPDPKSIALPVQAENARWAFSRDPVVKNDNGTKAPSFDSPVVRAPSAVYTAGFQPDVVVADAQRFTGKAVTFLSVAKFETN